MPWPLATTWLVEPTTAAFVGLVHKGQQIIAEAFHVEPRLVPLPSGFREVRGDEGGIGAKLQDGSPKVIDYALILLDANLKEMSE